MILYLDASALVKRYIAEEGSREVNSWIESAGMVATALITRVEVSAAIGRARQMRLISNTEGQAALNQFRSEWDSFLRLPVNENTVIRGDFMAQEHILKGYDATHLACALIWQETLNQPVTLATFDRQLLEAARDLKMEILPVSLQ